MDDYLEDILDDIDLKEELLAVMDDATVWDESDEFRLMFQDSDTPDTGLTG